MEDATILELILTLILGIILIYALIILPIRLKYKVVEDNFKNQAKILEQQQIIMNNYQNMNQQPYQQPYQQSYQQPYQTDIQERK